MVWGGESWKRRGVWDEGGKTTSCPHKSCGWGSPILLWLKVDVDKMDVEQHNKWEEISTKDFTAHSLEFLTSGNCLQLESTNGSEIANSQ